MNQGEYNRIEGYMISAMRDSAHDVEHVRRVLRGALAIAAAHPDADPDVLTAACLLHDVGRQAQFDDPKIDHAAEGARMARAFLLGEGWDEGRADRVADCVRTHRYRGDDQPATIEAKILFDADKLDAAGALGIARTLLYSGAVGRPLAEPGDLAGDAPSGRSTHSFVAEYRYKLAHVYDRFYTDEGRSLARSRRRTAEDFFAGLLDELGGVETAAKSGKGARETAP
ncbi:MAG: HD domain-containing protein [Clostridiales bacterium]|nr:HD domain-containing protein [Clostridiales bacterium]